MTPLENDLRDAFRARASQVPPDAVPPLRLPVRGRGFLALAYGGGESKGGLASRSWLAPAACAVLVAAVAAGAVALSHVMPGRPAPGRHQQSAAATVVPSAAATPNAAAAWVAAQVSRAAIVSCDPVMCRALKAHGIPGGDLEELRPGAADPFGSAVIVATAAVRNELGARLSSFYAPTIIASFGSGSTQTDIRVIAPDGAAAYNVALSADLAARKAAAAQMLRNKRLLVSATARKRLSAGQVDSRLLSTIVIMAGRHPVSVVAFGDSGPGAGAGGPLRSVNLTATEKAPRARRTAVLRQLMKLVNAQSPPFRPAQAEIVRLPGGRPGLRVEFAAPSPLGLLGPVAAGGA